MRKVPCLFFTLFLALFGALPSVHAQSQASVDPAGHQWWQNAVFYEIYPRSFADSNNDGIGDLKGITSKLDYLKKLGVDAIWITPCYPSPQVDFGYDVSDYENIDPMYGTLQDFDRMEKHGRKRRNSHHHGFRDEPHLRPAQVVSGFALLAHLRAPQLVHLARWQEWRSSQQLGFPFRRLRLAISIPATEQYYYHYFYKQQPDLNWRNPAVEKAMFDVTRWWYQRGVAGFRLDAVDTLFEDPKLHDNPVLPGKNDYGDPKEENKYNTNLPELHVVLRNLRQGGEPIQCRAHRRNLDQRY